MDIAAHDFNGAYMGGCLDRIAFPLGGIGTGMLALEGTGAWSHVSLRHHPQVFNQPKVFSALCVKGVSTPRVLEGPVPTWKTFGSPGTGNGGSVQTSGFPRFRECSFEARFPFATISLADPDMPVEVEFTGWSPFTPGDADNSSMPVAALEFTFHNPTAADIEAVYSLHAENFMSLGQGGARQMPVADGFALVQDGTDEEPWRQGAFAATAPGENPDVDCAWFRGGWYDPMTMIWKTIAAGETLSRPPHADGDPGKGASLYIPFQLEAGAERTIRILLSWYVPKSSLRNGGDCRCEDNDPCLDGKATHEPWYAGRFDDLDAVISHWTEHCDSLRQASARFRDCFYDTTLPPEVVEAVAANLTILKSPTCLRQKDGRLWCWEGCCDEVGCCNGTCTHVWNYAQALCHLFPELERTLRETEFTVSQDERGHQAFRSSLPIRPTEHTFHAASDGQLGGIMKAYRDWRISGDSEWIRALWPRIRKSLDYCIETWDPDHKGVLVEPHHNTYDIEFWGADGMCSSFYIGALQAAKAIGETLEDDVTLYTQLYAAGREYMESMLFDGEYFIQKIQWEGLRAASPTEDKMGIRLSYSPEAQELLEQEGPKYQYGTGCLSDGVLGAWMAAMAGLDDILAPAKVSSHLCAVHRYNLRSDLSDHINPQRPTFAVGDEGGLLLCSWPKGGQLSLPFVYSNEVWTGIEYQVASHLMLCGEVDRALEIVRLCRLRYDGQVRNPFDEYECGHWYARAMSSYGMLASLSGARYDAVTRTLHLKPMVEGDFRAFLCTATGYGTVGVEDGKTFLDVVSGHIDVDTFDVK
ncbi:MAG: hypothetical protein KAI66_16725 [Lentisphaeria bacterium]|nr:hypothetical protein [Lentisphaeria bacterium]